MPFKSSEFPRTAFMRSSQNHPYSITYVERPAEHFLPGRIETRKGYKDAPDRARAPEIETVQATQS